MTFEQWWESVVSDDYSWRDDFKWDVPAMEAARRVWDAAVGAERERAAQWAELYYEPNAPDVGNAIAGVIRLGDPVPQLKSLNADEFLQRGGEKPPVG